MIAVGIYYFMEAEMTERGVINTADALVPRWKHESCIPAKRWRVRGSTYVYLQVRMGSKCYRVDMPGNNLGRNLTYCARFL